MSAPPDLRRDRQLVELARGLERLMARRRKILAQLRAIDDDIRTNRKLLNSMTQPELLATVDLGELPGDTPSAPRCTVGGAAC